MIGSIAAELTVMRKRVATWVLLGLWATLAAFFAYVLPYADERGMAAGPEKTRALNDLLPHQFVGTVLGGFPFFGGVLVLSGMVVMAWNLWHTAALARADQIKPIIVPIPEAIPEPIPEQVPPPLPARG